MQCIFGMPWKFEVKDKVFTPLYMTHTIKKELDFSSVVSALHVILKFGVSDLPKWW